MSLFDDIQTLEEQVQQVLAKETYTSVENFRQAYTDAIIDSFGDFSNAELSEIDIDEVVRQALRDSADFIDSGLAAEIEQDVSSIVGDTMDFYNEQGINLPNISEAIERREAIQVLTDTMSTNMESMRDELLDGTIEALTDQVAKGELNRAKLADTLLEVADGRMHHARTNARMVVSGYNRIARDQVRQDAELKHGYYYGDPRINTRPFCIRCIGKVFSLEQIELLDNGQGLDVKIYCGGWNCIHSWMWVEPDWDEELAQRFDADQSITESEEEGLKLKVPPSAD